MLLEIPLSVFLGHRTVLILSVPLVSAFPLAQTPATARGKGSLSLDPKVLPHPARLSSLPSSQCPDFHDLQL